MSNRFLPKKSSVAGKTPLVGDLQVGELAINLADKKIYSKDASGNIVTLGGSSFQPTVEYLSGNGGTSFTLANSYTSAEYVTILVEGNPQFKNSYTIVGTALTFSEAPPTGTGNIEVSGAVLVGSGGGSVSNATPTTAGVLYGLTDTNGAVALGYNATFSNVYAPSVILGNNCFIEGAGVAVGRSVSAYGNGLAFGEGSTANGSYSLAMGVNCYANMGSVAIGQNATAAQGSVVISAGTGGAMNPQEAGFFVNAVTQGNASNVLYFDTNTKKITYGDVPAGSGGGGGTASQAALSELFNSGNQVTLTLPTTSNAYAYGMVFSFDGDYSSVNLMTYSGVQSIWINGKGGVRSSSAANSTSSAVFQLPSYQSGFAAFGLTWTSATNNAYSYMDVSTIYIGGSGSIVAGGMGGIGPSVGEVFVVILMSPSDYSMNPAWFDNLLAADSSITLEKATLPSGYGTLAAAVFKVPASFFANPSWQYTDVGFSTAGPAPNIYAYWFIGNS